MAFLVAIALDRDIRLSKHCLRYLDMFAAGYPHCKNDDLVQKSARLNRLYAISYLYFG
ncbi:uncharacterized protein PHALS_07011 [Plasmopara halstedii]|uniref:Uncharacterized protein n=1 Tax=Plasmopara halstedii TaxID=4781 RepID=A0A0P1B4J6_PLAHL|nr:uncharacterized protein PHALS_07011 [Plasmopara halstedii]CEG49239.1 hypothetical protein PHALS_07011 [Plasmopara halstedii]|eukprot:XP_024585608.1 hypothetical protein PHALS_07011 [Plasmopara halstedii]